MPEALLDEGIDDSDFNELLLAYYRDNWAQVRQTIEGNLAAYPVDAETKEAFREALSAHEHGFYRSVCCTLIIEVERVVRIHLYDGKVGSFSVSKLIVDDFSILPMSMLPDARVGFVGYFYLEGHLYDHIKNEVDRNRFVNHRVPNRHATLHGLLTYPTVQSSLNSIFALEYVLQLISARNATKSGANPLLHHPVTYPFFKSHVAASSSRPFGRPYPPPPEDRQMMWSPGLTTTPTSFDPSTRSVPFDMIV